MSALADAYPDLHTVVFDVNVYLDVASLVGPPFTWEKLQGVAVSHRTASLPHLPDRRVDSLRAIAVSQGGRFAGPEPLQVWTSDHIDDLVVRKASQPRGGPTPETRGLGWSHEHAQDLLIDLVDELVYEKTDGGRVTIVGVDGNPPLGHEDACVFTTALGAATDAAPPSIKYCVTCDGPFRKAQGLNPNVTVLYPHEYVDMVRKSRQALALASMRTAT